jgi:lipopolysaccharide export system permease protein
MKLIEWYIFRRIATTFLGTLTAITAIVWIVQGLNRLNVATDSGSTIVSFLYVATLLIPSVIPLIMPFALLLATVQIFKAMNADSEMAVIKASGGPKRLIVMPVLILGLLAGAASFILENGVTPYSRQEFRTFIEEVRANLLTSLLQEGTFQTIDNGLTAHIAERVPNGGFGGLFIADRRDPDQELTYFAREAAIAEDNEGRQLLLMRDGELHQRDTDSDAVSIVRFASYAFDLSAFAPAAGAYIVFPKDQTTPYLFNPDPENPRFQENPREFSAELHKRMTNWTLPVIMGLIGVLVAGEARTSREVNGTMTATALTLGVTYFLASYLLEDIAAQSAFGIALLYILPLTVGGLLLILLAKDIRPALPRPVARLVEQLSDRFVAISRRATAASVKSGAQN